MTERKHLLNWALGRISEILIMINETKALNWNLMYRKETDESIKSMTKWEREYRNILVGEEYIYVREVDTGDLLYAVNVTGDSLLTALSEFMDLLSKKF